MKTKISEIQPLSRDEANKLKGGYSSLPNPGARGAALINTNCAAGSGGIKNTNCFCKTCDNPTDPGGNPGT